MACMHMFITSIRQLELGGRPRPLGSYTTHTMLNGQVCQCRAEGTVQQQMDRKQRERCTSTAYVLCCFCATGLLIAVSTKHVMQRRRLCRRSVDRNGRRLACCMPVDSLPASV